MTQLNYRFVNMLDFSREMRGSKGDLINCFYCQGKQGKLKEFAMHSRKLGKHENLLENWENSRNLLENWENSGIFLENWENSENLLENTGNS